MTTLMTVIATVSLVSAVVAVTNVVPNRNQEQIIWQRFLAKYHRK